MKQLLATVSRDERTPERPWLWSVETKEEGKPSKLVSEGRSELALDAMSNAEGTAQREGFGLSWCGLVGKGVQTYGEGSVST